MNLFFYMALGPFDFDMGQGHYYILIFCVLVNKIG